MGFAFGCVAMGALLVVLAMCGLFAVTIAAWETFIDWVDGVPEKRP